MSALAKVRCRNPKCSNIESPETPFKKCARCVLARYCSRECQATDWPIHQSICIEDRVLVDENGEVITATDAIKRMNQELFSPTEATTSITDENTDSALVQSKIPTGPVYLGPEVIDSQVMLQSLQRLQIETNMFYVYQHEAYVKANSASKNITTKIAGKMIPVKKVPAKKPERLNRALLFIQTESTVADMRHQTLGPDSPQFDRVFVCYYMTIDEFNNEVVKNHPNPMLRLKKFSSNLIETLKTSNPTETVVTVAVFGCGSVYTDKFDLPPYNEVLDVLKEPQYQAAFANNDCLEIYIDRP